MAATAVCAPANFRRERRRSLSIGAGDAARAAAASQALPARPTLGCLGGSVVEFHAWRPELAESLGKTVHFKGFAARVDFEEEHTKQEAQETLDFIKGTDLDTLVWDGDSYQADSFTCLIPRLYGRCAPRPPRLVMFLRDLPEERARVVRDWQSQGLPIDCYLCEASLDYRRLGGKALECTGSKLVVCFGGGAVVRDEYAHSSGVQYYVSPTSRARAGGGTEHPSLFKPREILQDDNLIALRGPAPIGRTVSGDA